jgi:hypothetical protein
MLAVLGEELLFILFTFGREIATGKREVLGSTGGVLRLGFLRTVTRAVGFAQSW